MVLAGRIVGDKNWRKADGEGTEKDIEQRKKINPAEPA